MKKEFKQFNVGELLINSSNRIHTIMNVVEGKCIWTKWFNPHVNDWIESVYSYNDMFNINWTHYPIIINNPENK